MSYIIKKDEKILAFRGYDDDIFKMIVRKDEGPVFMKNPRPPWIISVREIADGLADKYGGVVVEVN